MEAEGSNLKRLASASPPGTSSHDVKRLRIGTDLWTEREHQEQDDRVKQRLMGKRGKSVRYDTDNESHMAIVFDIVGQVALEGPHSELLRPDLPTIEHCIEVLEGDPDLLELVGESHTSGSYKDVRCLPLFRKKTIHYETDGQKKAVQESWNREFSGDAADALWRHISDYYQPNDRQIYAHYNPIVQSSGMGKSRTVDELAKKHLVIPINLRGPNSTGYPPSDGRVQDFLVSNGQRADVYNRNCAFLEALFERTATTLREGLQQVKADDLVPWFRAKMTEGQTFQGPGTFRADFYRDVINNATEKCELASQQSKPAYTSPGPGDLPDFAPAKACKTLIKVLSDGRQNSPMPEPSTSSGPRTQRQGKLKALDKPKEDGPLIILAFDEAHTPTNEKDTESTRWSNFSELRRALRAVHGLSCFSLFMSTTGKISQFTPAPEEDSSFRLFSGELKLIQPFTDLGFDTLAQQISLKGSWDLEQLTSNTHMAHLGRPLFGSLYDAGDKAVRENIVTFAAAKLLNAAKPALVHPDDDQKLACLSQRIPLEFNSTTSVDQANERKQVEGHMRVCLKIDAAFETMVTVSASEPLLSEAAYSVMARPSFDVPNAMKAVLEGFSINKGDRGEFLTMLLFTMARDESVGPPVAHDSPTSRIIDVGTFVTRKLFRDTDATTTRLFNDLREDFPSAKMHFNHYVKVHEYEAIKADYLLMLFSRGAGILCANNQYAIDGINPFLTGNQLLRKNLGLILWQSKNDPAFTSTPQPELFEAMDVYKLKILKKGAVPVPLIKIVFALAARTPSLTVVKHPPSDSYNAIVYDIWCAGMSSDIFNVVEGAQERLWNALLQASYGWKSIYEGRGVDKDLGRSMNPGAATHDGHRSRWVV